MSISFWGGVRSGENSPKIYKNAMGMKSQDAAKRGIAMNL